MTGKNEVSLGNASGALVSHSGWEKFPWHVHGNSCQYGNLSVMILNRDAFGSVSITEIDYCQVKNTFGLAWREVCVSRRYPLLGSFHVFISSFSSFFKCPKSQASDIVNLKDLIVVTDLWGLRSQYYL